MSRHRFAVGEAVDFLPTSLDRNVPRGRYTVERLLPTERGRRPLYRVRCKADGHERVVDEGQLSPAAIPPPPWPPPPPSP